MTRAIVPTEIPPLGEATEWRRSTRRGAMFHAHTGLGRTLCDKIILDRHKSEASDNLGDMKYWGVCPVCQSKAKRGST